MKLKNILFTTILSSATLASLQASLYNGYYDEEMALQKAIAASFQQEEDEELARAIAASLEDYSSPVSYNAGMSEDEALAAALNASLENIERDTGVDYALQHGLYASMESANKEKNKGHYLGYNPYEDVQEAELKVAASLAAVKEEQERLQASFIKKCDASLFDSYETIKMARLAGISEEDLKEAVDNVKREMTPYMYAFDAYFKHHSRFGIKLTLDQMVEQNPEGLLSAIVKDTGLTRNAVKNIFSNTYGWDF